MGTDTPQNVGHVLKIMITIFFFFTEACQSHHI